MSPAAWLLWACAIALVLWAALGADDARLFQRAAARIRTRHARHRKGHH